MTSTVAAPHVSADELPPGSLYDRFLERMLLMRMSIFERTLSLTPRGWLRVSSAALLLGVVTYASLQWVYQRQLIDAILAVDGIEDFCSETGGLDPASCIGTEGKPRIVSQHLLWALLTESEVLDVSEAETPVKLEGGLLANHPAFAVACFLQNKVLSTEVDKKPECKESKIIPAPTESGTLDLVLSGAWATCQNASVNPARDLQKGRIAHFLAGIYPGSIQDAAGLLSGDPGWFNPFNNLGAAFRFAPSASVADVEILSELTRLSQAQWSAKKDDRQGYVIFDSERCQNSILDAHDEFRRKQAFEKIGAFLLGRVGSNPAVRNATTNLTFWTGPEQLGLIIVGYFAFVLITLRGLASLATARGANLARDNTQAKTRSERLLEQFVTNWLKAKAMDPDPAVRTYWKDLITDELTSGRWPVRLAISTLPAIGFIGTVRGILLSLSNADAIVWASTQAERADAIASLSGNLGLAFATTMIALLVGVIMSLLSALEGRFEERTILSLFREGKLVGGGAPPTPSRADPVPSTPSPAPVHATVSSTARPAAGNRRSTRNAEREPRE
ncbi:hypothetical protein GOB25_19120 [Sinorhizobium meliloti]|nr:hypothetical protein [Sinorhizobium meliloti]